MGVDLTPTPEPDPEPGRGRRTRAQPAAPGPRPSCADRPLRPIWRPTTVTTRPGCRRNPHRRLVCHGLSRVRFQRGNAKRTHEPDGRGARPTGSISRACGAPRIGARPTNRRICKQDATQSWTSPPESKNASSNSSVTLSWSDAMTSASHLMLRRPHGSSSRRERRRRPIPVAEGYSGGRHLHGASGAPTDVGAKVLKNDRNLPAQVSGVASVLRGADHPTANRRDRTPPPDTTRGNPTARAAEAHAPQAVHLRCYAGMFRWLRLPRPAAGASEVASPA
jgi:hypothetical protein